MALTCLIVKTSALGDIVQAFSVVELIRQYYPDAVISWVVEESIVGLVRQLEGIDEVLTINSKQWKTSLFRRTTFQQMRSFFQKLRIRRYDVVFDLQGNIKSAGITFLARAQYKVGFGFTTIPEKPASCVLNTRFNPPPHQNIRADYCYIVSQFLNSSSQCQKNGVRFSMHSEQEVQLHQLRSILSQKKGPIWMVCSGSRWPNKQMKDQDLTALLKQVSQEINPSYLFVCGNREEQEQCEGLCHLFPGSMVLCALPFPVLYAVMESVDLVISMDSFPLHLAALSAVPTFSIFGASSAYKYAPTGIHHASYQGNCPYHQTFAKRCPLLRSCPTGACIHDIDTHLLYQAVKKHWETVRML